MGQVRGTSRPTRPQSIAPEHDLDAFDSGAPAFDAWLQQRARANEAAGASRTFVIAEGQRVVGYYSLAAASILHSQTTSKVWRNMPNPVPAVLIGRLALDRAWQGKGLGVGLLQDAVLRIAGAAETIACAPFSFMRCPMPPSTSMSISAFALRLWSR